MQKLAPFCIPCRVCYPSYMDRYLNKHWCNFCIYQNKERLVKRQLVQKKTVSKRLNYYKIFVPRSHAPFGQRQESWPLGKHAHSNNFVFSDNQIVRLDSKHAQSDRKSINRGLSVLNLSRGRDSCCWLKGARPMGTKMLLQERSTLWTSLVPFLSFWEATLTKVVFGGKSSVVLLRRTR